MPDILSAFWPTRGEWQSAELYGADNKPYRKIREPSFPQSQRYDWVVAWIRQIKITFILTH